MRIYMEILASLKNTEKTTGYSGFFGIALGSKHALSWV
jgi:hypothetical protein